MAHGRPTFTKKNNNKWKLKSGKTVKHLCEIASHFSYVCDVGDGFGRWFGMCQIVVHICAINLLNTVTKVDI